MKRTFLLFALLYAASVSARVIPAVESAAPIPDVQVLDEAGNGSSLRSLLAAMGGGPVIVLPIYSRCSLSCPIQTQKLKQALTGFGPAVPVRVLVFSFDPEETVETIRQYRELEGVPQSWSMIHAREPAIRSFFDFFHYWVMDDKGQMVHPDRIFLLDSSLRWRFTVTGLNWSPQEIGRALDEAQSPGMALWMRTHPDALAWAGLLCVLASTGLLWVRMIRQRRSSRSVAI